MGRLAAPFMVSVYTSLLSQYSCFSLGFFLLCPHLAQVFWAIQAVDKEDAVKMVDLVLEDAGKPAFSAFTDFFAACILALHNHHCCPADIVACITRDAQTSLRARLFSLGFNNLRIDHRYLAVFICRDKNSN